LGNDVYSRFPLKKKKERRKCKGSRGYGGPTHVALSCNLRLDVALIGQTTYISYMYFYFILKN
jgi:hypothetical protein